jgi:hypothetical protein
VCPAARAFVHGQQLDDPEFTNAVLQNAFDLWFEPEIKRRQEAGALPKPFPLWAAQVILEPNGPGTIRFNDQIRGVFQVAIDASTPGPIAKGAQLSLSELGSIQGMQLTLDVGNYGPANITANIFSACECSLRINRAFDADRLPRPSRSRPACDGA